MVAQNNDRFKKRYSASHSPYTPGSENGALKPIFDLVDEYLGAYNSLKGHLAESFLKQFFFHNLNYIVEETGVEHTRSLTNVMVKLGMAPYYGLQDDRRNQDFCVYLPDRRKSDGSAFPVYIEVKYSQNSAIAVDTLKAYTKYENCACVFALFDNDGIYILDRRDLGKIRGDKVYFKNCPPLSEHRLFSFTKAEKIAARIFSKTFIPAFFGGLLSYRDMKKKLTQDLQQMMRGNDNDCPGMKFRK